MEIAWALGGLFILVTLIFVAISFFLPEWIGITGNKAKEIMKEQAGDETSPTDKDSDSKPS